MELGSTEHKQKLLQGIIRVALKTATLGLLLGIMLIVPLLFRENTFSIGLAYAGVVIIIGSQLYATLLAWKKYKNIIKPFNETYRSDKADQD